MYLLAIETTGAYASVALLQAADSGNDARRNTASPGLEDDRRAAGAPEDAPRILGVIHGSDRFSHLQNLTPQIEQILQENALSVKDLSAVAVSHGPGSFTGIRIGVSTARALSQVLDIPCVPVSSLEALALRAADLMIDANAGACPETALGPDPETAADPDADTAAGLDFDTASGRTLVCPILDARRKQVYGAAYELTCGRPACRIEPASCLMTEFLQKLEMHLTTQPARRILFIGDGIDTCGEIIEEWSTARIGSTTASAAGDAATPVEIIYAPETLRYQDAATVALRGWQLYQDGRTCGYMQLQPEYLRMAEAEKKLKDKLAAAGVTEPKPGAQTAAPGTTTAGAAKPEQTS